MCGLAAKRELDIIMYINYIEQKREYSNIIPDAFPRKKQTANRKTDLLIYYYAYALSLKKKSKWVLTDFILASNKRVTLKSALSTQSIDVIKQL